MKAPSSDCLTIGLLLTPDDEAAVRNLLSSPGVALQPLSQADVKNSIHSCDCVLISHRSPDMDCLRVLESVRTTDGLLPSACIVLGHGARLATAVSAVKAGAQDFLLTDELTSEKLHATILEAIESFERRTGLERQSREHAQLAAIVASSTDAIVSLEADGTRIRTWSPGAEQLFGYTADEAIGETVDALIIPPSKAEERVQIYDRIRRQFHNLIVETERRHKSGALIPVEINVSPIRLDGGVIDGYSVVFRNLRERRKAEEAAREALAKLSLREAELARAQQIAGIGSYEVEIRDGAFINRRSPEYLRIHGLGAEDRNEAHEDWVARIHPEDRARAEQTFRDALAGDRVEYQTEYRIIRRADGATRWIRVLAEFDRSSSNEPTRLFGTHIDITEQKLAADSLRASEDRLRLAMGAARLGLFEIDWEKRQRHWSPELRALLAVPDSLDISSNSDLVSRIIPPEQLERYKSKLLSSFDPANAEYEDEHEVVCFDGRRIHVLLRARTMFEEAAHGPKPVRTVGFMMDVTQHKRAELQRDLLVRELDHRIKNIFSNISSIISLSAHTADNVEDYAASLRDRLFALTAVHDLARNADLKGTTSLAALAAAITSRGLADKIRARGPDLSLSVQAATSLGMVLNELLTNALKYGALSNSEGTVALSWAVEGDEFTMQWLESGGPVVMPSSRVGFGSRLIERVVTGLGGRSEVSRASSGLRFEMACPLESLS